MEHKQSQQAAGLQASIYKALQRATEDDNRLADELWSIVCQHDSDEAEQVRKRYRALTILVHPDHNRNETVSEQQSFPRSIATRLTAVLGSVIKSRIEQWRSRASILHWQAIVRQHADAKKMLPYLVRLLGDRPCSLASLFGFAIRVTELLPFSYEKRRDDIVKTLDASYEQVKHAFELAPPYCSQIVFDEQMEIVEQEVCKWLAKALVSSRKHRSRPPTDLTLLSAWSEDRNQDANKYGGLPMTDEDFEIANNLLACPHSPVDFRRACDIFLTAVAKEVRTRRGSSRRSGEPIQPARIRSRKLQVRQLIDLRIEDVLWMCAKEECHPATAHAVSEFQRLCQSLAAKDKGETEAKSTQDATQHVTHHATQQVTPQMNHHATQQATPQMTHHATRQATSQTNHAAATQTNYHATQQATSQITHHATRQAMPQTNHAAATQTNHHATQQAKQAAKQRTQKTTKHATRQATQEPKVQDGHEPNRSASPKSCALTKSASDAANSSVSIPMRSSNTSPLAAATPNRVSSDTLIALPQTPHPASPSPQSTKIISVPIDDASQHTASCSSQSTTHFVPVKITALSQSSAYVASSSLPPTTNFIPGETKTYVAAYETGTMSNASIAHTWQLLPTNPLSHSLECSSASKSTSTSTSTEPGEASQARVFADEEASNIISSKPTNATRRRVRPQLTASSTADANVATVTRQSVRLQHNSGTNHDCITKPTTLRRSARNNAKGTGNVARNKSTNSNAPKHADVRNKTEHKTPPYADKNLTKDLRPPTQCNEQTANIRSGKRKRQTQQPQAPQARKKSKRIHDRAVGGASDNAKGVTARSTSLFTKGPPPRWHAAVSALTGQYVRKRSYGEYWGEVISWLGEQEESKKHKARAQPQSYQRSQVYEGLDWDKPKRHNASGAIVPYKYNCIVPPFACGRSTNAGSDQDFIEMWKDESNEWVLELVRAGKREASFDL